MPRCLRGSRIPRAAAPPRRSSVRPRPGHSSRYGRERVNSSPCCWQNVNSTSLMKFAAVVHVDATQREGASRRRVRASPIKTALARTRSVTHSVHPLAISVNTKVCAKLPGHAVAAMRDKVALDEPWMRIAPVGECAHGNAAPHTGRRLRTTSPAAGRSRLGQHPIDGLPHSRRARARGPARRAAGGHVAPRRGRTPAAATQALPADAI